MKCVHCYENRADGDTAITGLCEDCTYDYAYTHFAQFWDWLKDGGFDWKEYAEEIDRLRKEAAINGKTFVF